MDAVGQITSITAQVLRRLADGIDGGVPEPKGQTIHIENLHVMDSAEAIAKLKAMTDRQSKMRFGGRF